MICKFDVDPIIKEFELTCKPIIVEVNKFDEASAKEFRKNFALAHSTGQPVIPVVIDSYGGQVYSLMSMISTIRHSELPVATIVQGKAMSCGAILFSCGKDRMRYMDPDATIMIHDVSSMSFGKVEEIKSNADETDRLNIKVYQIMASNIGKPDDYFLKQIHDKGHADWFLDAEECKSINLANHLRVPKFDVRIMVDICFE